MEELQAKEKFPDLFEHLLMYFAVPDDVWPGDLAQLPEDTSGEIRDLLRSRMNVGEVNQVLSDVERNFSTAVEMAKVECSLRRDLDQETKGSKQPSAKLGVRLRSTIGHFRAEFENNATPNAADICARILKDPVLERMVTLLLEMRAKGKVIDPLRNSVSFAVQHLLEVLELLFSAVDKGIVTGRVEPTLNFLASSVVDAVFRASGKIPGRTWDAYDEEETGVGLKTCRILAAALNNALPESFRKNNPADMVKPYRNAIRGAQKAD